MPVFTSIGLAVGATAATAAATGAAVVSGVTAVGGLAMSALSQPKMPSMNIPTPQVPAAAAPGARTDTGASVTVGTSADDIKSQRVSTGSRRTGTGSSQGDVLGGLGRSGLSI